MGRVIVCAVALAAAGAGFRPAPAATPGDPTEGQNGLDDALRPLAELNLQPDFELTREQKERIGAVRDGYATRMAAWRTTHAADFRHQRETWDALRQGRTPPGAENGRPTEQWPKLMRARQELMASVPSVDDAVDQVATVLTADQRRQFDAAASGNPAAAPASAGAPFASAVLPVPADGVPKAPGFYKLRFAGKVTTANGPRSFRMTYVVFLPKNYKPDGGPYPTLVFLHGAGEVGTDGNGVMVPGLGVAGDIRSRAGSKFADDFPMIVISPQCPPRGERWDQEPVLRGTLAVLDEAAAKLRVDRDRTYVTGLSMGGKGTWLLAGLDPDRFAAVVPIASSTLDEGLARRLRFDSVWAINGSEDIEDGADHERRMIAAAQSAGGDAKLTLLPGRDHGVWDDYYRDPAFYKWFLTHRRLTPAERATRGAATRPVEPDAR